jgi:hypothetical protein
MNPLVNVSIDSCRNLGRGLTFIEPTLWCSPLAKLLCLHCRHRVSKWGATAVGHSRTQLRPEMKWGIWMKKCHVLCVYRELILRPNCLCLTLHIVWKFSGYCCRVLINSAVFADILMLLWPTVATEVVGFLLPLVFWCISVLIGLDVVRWFCCQCILCYARCLLTCEIEVLCVCVHRMNFFSPMLLPSVNVASIYGFRYGIMAVCGCSIDMLFFLRDAFYVASIVYIGIIGLGGYFRSW